ncbi:MAG TPA: ATP synthase F1 subunit delta [Longimicrobiales bacterium]|nr:ATP synthase F1 subunit delta [Longimicrobiales bacterium]
MKASSIVARSYAASVFELAQQHGLTEEFTASFSALTAVLSDASIRNFLHSPKLDKNTKKATLRTALGERVHPLFLNFLLVVLDKRRQDQLTAIAREYHALAEEALGRMHVAVTVAHEPSAELHQEIRRSLSEIFEKTVVPHIHVDSRILGGIIVRHEDKVIDGSLRRRLVAMRRRLLEKA